MSEQHSRAARELASIVGNRQKQRLTISVGGESGSGKSEIAAALRNELGKRDLRVKILHLDNYYIIPPDHRNELRRDLGMDTVGIQEINWELVNANIDSFYKGDHALMPYLDLYTNQEDLLFSDLKRIDVLLVEGLYACYYPSDITVYIDLSYLETRSAQIARKKEEISQFRIEVLEKERREILKIRYQSNYFITPSFNVVANVHKNGISRKDLQTAGSS